MTGVAGVVRVGVRVHGRVRVLLVRVLLGIKKVVVGVVVGGGRGRVAAAAAAGVVRVRGCGGREDVGRGHRAAATATAAGVVSRCVVRALRVLTQRVLTLVLAVALGVVLRVREAGVPILLVLVLVRREVRMAAVRRHLVRERGQDRRCGRRHGRAVGRERGRGGRGERRDGRRRRVHGVVGVRVEVVERPARWWSWWCLKSMSKCQSDAPMHQCGW